MIDRCIRDYGFLIIVFLAIGSYIIKCTHHRHDCAQVMSREHRTLGSTLVLQGCKQSRHVARLKVTFVLAFIVLKQEFVKETTHLAQFLLIWLNILLVKQATLLDKLLVVQLAD